ncbi:hypothetical protein M422DRAFT_64569 [Sphaerobolus stellatus SS14]|nr:hypothetical protein M422DRAFT_64569 [Sphaerobolus stellatus SS14]
MSELEIYQLIDPSEEELEKLAELGSLAFHDEPLQMSLVDGDHERHGLFQYAMINLLVNLGEVWVAKLNGELVGIAVWIGPGQDLAISPEYYEELLDQLLPEGSPAKAWGGYASEGVRAQSWYLLQIAVHPAFMRKGIGSQLLKPIHQKADSGGLLTCLETDKAENLHFYSKVGYTVRGEEEYDTLVGDGKCTVWVVAREPESAGL